ncbi:hypothetical protein NQ317_012891 [Molorchus minor]|uniref:Uncharacterized protein n=1 Tax=Molorchus minor TaxID=1323400 RepID=A0ABQ9JQ94_9CUCU|nr:hypothetical protein NQ317_012891 [Molorchus minor]
MLPLHLDIMNGPEQCVLFKIKTPPCFCFLKEQSDGPSYRLEFYLRLRRTHIRTGSAGSITERDISHQTDCDEDLRCIKMLSIRGTSTTDNVSRLQGGRILTGSQDHTLEVFRLTMGVPSIHCTVIVDPPPACSSIGSVQQHQEVVRKMGCCVYGIY